MDRLLFIGIAGHAMRGLALAAQNRGYTVTGLDVRAAPPGSDWLDAHGLHWTRTPGVELLENVDRVLLNNEMGLADPLMVEAARRGIRISSFAEFLGEIMEGDHVIAVTGTHGKTSTTAFITWIFDQAGWEPNFLVGALPLNYDVPVRLTHHGLSIVEGDEFTASNREGKSKVQYYHPNVLVITSVEHDHPDVFPTLEAVVDRFNEFVRDLPIDGRLISWAESKTVQSVAANARCETITYGVERGDYTASDIAFTPVGIEFTANHHGQELGRISTPMFGRHNVMNVLAAIAVSLSEGISFEQVVATAATFKGTYRRFNTMTPPDALITVLDDYGHHSTEVQTTIQAAKLHFPGRRIVAVFQPHTYSRIKALLDGYQHAFADADLVYVSDIESAREVADQQTVSGRDVITGVGDKATFEPDRAKLIERLQADTKPGDVVLVLSVGSYGGLATELATVLNPAS